MSRTGAIVSLAIGGDGGVGQRATVIPRPLDRRRAEAGIAVRLQPGRGSTFVGQAGAGMTALAAVPDSGPVALAS